MRRFGRLVAVWLLVGACGTTPGGGSGGEPTSSDLGQAGDEGSYRFVDHDVTSVPDGADAVGSPKDEGPSPTDTPSPTDPGGPEPDLPAVADTPALPDAAEPECQACPPTEPICKAGKCVCTAESCPEGSFCDGADCKACTVDGACGPACTNCLLWNQACSPEGTECVECGPSTPCGEGYQCLAGGCSACDSDAACGPDCEACSGTTPLCWNGTCGCKWDSCDAGKLCEAGVCVACDKAKACGTGCVDCTKTGTPVCNDGQCKCAADSECGDGKLCVGGACDDCPGDDPMHCGPSCAQCTGATPVCTAGKCVCSQGSCPGGQWCSAGAVCEPCNDAAHCGASCAPCGGSTPLCGGGACVECTGDGDCGAGTWCSGGKCVTCAGDDPKHCGPACAACGVGAQCLAGSCVPCDTEAACGPKCEACGGGLPFCGSKSLGCVQCLADPDCPEYTHCDGGTCKPDCLAEGCATDVAPDGKKCSKARIIGRTNAQSGFLYKSDTTNAGNNDDLSTTKSDCWDAKYDHFYRIWLFVGETVELTTSVFDYDFDVMMKLYQGTLCDDSGANPIVCVDDGSDGKPETKVFTATQDGWITIVVDGRMSWNDDYDWGEYSLAAKLTCSTPNCCCP